MGKRVFVVEVDEAADEMVDADTITEALVPDVRPLIVSEGEYVFLTSSGQWVVRLK